MNKKNFERRAEVCVANGTYLKDGKEKTRWNRVGTLIATPNLTASYIQFDATTQGEGNKARIFWLEGKSPREFNAEDIEP